MNNQRMVGGSLGRRFGLVALAASLVTVLAAGSTQGQGKDNQGKYVTEASIRLVKLIGKANNDGFVLDADRFSIGGGWIKQSKTNWVNLYTLNLTGGTAYRFL